ncbi:MAG: HigA family addiction module antitoxin [Gemmatimonadota bacterium]
MASTDPATAHPGDVLQKDFLEPLGMTQTELARRLDVPFQRVNQIINRRRAITPDTALRLGRLFGTPPEFWLDLQLKWELHEAAHSQEGRDIEQIRPIHDRPKAEPIALRERGAATGRVETAAPAGILELIVERLVEAIDPRKIILFGSTAVGEAGPRSDIDLLIIDDEPFGSSRSRREQLRRARRALSGLRIAKDILIYSADELERWRDSPNHILARALRQGRVLYERP